MLKHKTFKSITFLFVVVFAIFSIFNLADYSKAQAGIDSIEASYEVSRS